MGSQKNDLITELKQFKKKISKDTNIAKLIFFGSRALGECHEDSDVDLIIVSKKFNKVSMLKRSPELYIKWHLDYPVDFLCYTPEEFDRLSKQVSIVSHAVKEGIEI